MKTTQKITLNELKDLVKEIMSEEMGAKSPINKFVYFGYNYPQNFIEQIWGESGISTHLQSKFDKAYQSAGAGGAMNRFYVELDEGNKMMLEEYIINNYRG